jgi:TRAP-type C4-dicarboxylate transport system permease large subunit
LSIDQILSQTFDLYGLRFKQFFLPFLVSGIMTGALYAIVQWQYLTPMAERIRSITPTTTPQEIITWLITFLPALIVVTVLVGIVTWVVSITVTGIMVKFASDTLEKGHASLRESLDIVLSRLASLLGANIVSGILVGLGLFLFFVPGIILGIMFSLVVPVIMIEQKWCFESLGRSKKLVSRRWGKTFVLLIMVGIMVGIVGGIASLLTTSLGAASTFVASLTTAFIAPISPIAITFLYYSMVARENLPSQK